MISLGRRSFSEGGRKRGRKDAGASVSILEDHALAALVPEVLSLFGGEFSAFAGHVAIGLRERRVEGFRMLLRSFFAPRGFLRRNRAFFLGIAHRSGPLCSAIRLAPIGALIQRLQPISRFAI